MSDTPQTFETALDQLPPKRRQFVLHYLDCLNATEAARRAGYAKAGQEGHRLLKNAEVAAIVQHGFAAQTISRSEVLARLAAHATGSIEDFIALPASPTDDDSKPLAAAAADGEAAPNPGHWRLDLAKAKRLGKMHLIKKLKWGEYGPEIELHDPQAALIAIGKHYRLFVDRAEISGPDGGPVEINADDRRMAAEELQQWRQEQIAKLSSGLNALLTRPTSSTDTGG